MMDAEGPGAIVRIWSANPAGNIRIYLDKNPEPVIVGPMEEVLSGKWKIGDSLTMTLDNMSDQAATTVDQVIPQDDDHRCNLIRVEDAPTSAISSGREIKNQVGPDLTPVDFGAAQSPPVVGDPEVGFRSPILPAHVGLEVGMRIRGETIATDTSGVVARNNEFATVKLKEND